MKGMITSGDFIYVNETTEIITESLRRILLTEPGERVGNVKFGCRLKSFLFNFENELVQDIENEIRRAINAYEPRVTVDEVDINIDSTETFRAFLNIKCTIKETFNELHFTEELSLGVV